ncbi:MFS transporter [Agrobacterium sp. lyk4-40-TYG-31]|uniref:MFS transporter n=1 Tax=Agrobacterium sp. lyk4-40-TYG-31 TaxID=3040276 RepID=UPI00254E6BCA|nr:MFS transporter [Agrobacterium sp. lyk4-40-TYG-31]
MSTDKTYSFNTDAAQAETAENASARRRILIAGTIGTTIEWYDFFLYGLIAPIVFDKLFFPKFDQLTATLAVFATFAVGFLARPLGGLVFGHFGDRIGRKSVLLVTLLIMGLSTMLIGLLPTYADVGVLATLALLLLRFLQGFALGGESTAASLMAIETAPGDRRGFAAAIIQAAGPLGVVLASLAAMAITQLSEPDLLSWGWRVPFLISGVLVGIGIYIRLRIEESSTFRQAAVRSETNSKIPALEALKSHPKPILAVLVAEMAQTSFFYLTAIFTLSFATRQLGVSKEVMTQAVLFANIVAMVAMPIIGRWSDRTGRKRLFLAGLILAALSMLVFYSLLATQNTALIMGAVIITAGIIHPLMFSTEGSYFPELFPTRIRFSGVSIGKQMGTVLGGGLAPLIATALYAATGSTWSIVAYYVVIAIAAALALRFVRETKDDPLSH